MELKRLMKKEPERNKSGNKAGRHTGERLMIRRQKKMPHPLRLKGKHKADMIYFQNKHPLSKLNVFIYINL